MKLDRKQAPAIGQITHVDFVEPQKHQIAEHTDLLWIAEVDDEAVKLDLIFDAGTLQDKKIVAKLSSALLLSGTPQKSSTEISAAIDGLGGFFNVETGHEETVVTIYALRDTIMDIFQIVMDALENCIFPETEFQRQLQQAKQSFMIGMQKVSVLARRAFVQQLLGNTGYGKITQETDFENVSRDEVAAFHQKHFLKGLARVCIVGNIAESDIDSIIHRVRPRSRNSKAKFPQEFTCQAARIDVPKSGSVQSAIRIGRLLFNRQHPDYLEFSVLNTILGGYFGSRLMSNIREDKGYTYGIGSGVLQLRHGGYFFISTEVGVDVAEAAIEEVKNEIVRLQQEPIAEEELKLVRNYAIGKLLKGSDGPFSMMDRYLAVERFGMDLSHYDLVIQTYQNCSAERLQELAQRYLSWENLVVVRSST
jgi:zinc protease